MTFLGLNIPPLPFLKSIYSEKPFVFKCGGIRTANSDKSLSKNGTLTSTQHAT